MTPASGRHPCPADGCSESVDNAKLLCWSDWRRVPAALQQAVYAAWRGREGAGTAEHTAACKAAIEAANLRRAARRG